MNTVHLQGTVDSAVKVYTRAAYVCLTTDRKLYIYDKAFEL